MYLVYLPPSSPPLQDYTVREPCIFDRLRVIVQRPVGESRANRIGAGWISRIGSKETVSQL